MVESMTARLAAQLKANPNDAEGWLRLGRAYVVKGQHELAADAFVAAARLRGNDADLMLQAVAALLAPVKEDAPLPARAVALLREVAIIRPASPEVLWYLGVVAARDGRKDEARREWSQLLPILAPGGEDYKMVQAALSGLNAP
jgi:cytochrome c-type biogenesis protein CcmH